MSSNVASERALDRLRRLQLLTGRVAAARTPEELAAIVVDHGAEALGASIGVFVRASGPTDLVIIASRGVPESVAQHGTHLSIDARVPTAAAFRTHESEWLETAEECARRHPDLPPEVVARTGAIAVLPLRIGADLLGVMTFGFVQSRAFPADERATIETFASQVAQALDRADGYAREVAIRRRLEGFALVAEQLSTALTTSDVAGIVVDQGTRIARADTCTLYLLDETTGALDLIGERGCSPHVVERVRRIGADSDNPVRQTLIGGTAIWAENEAEYVAFYPALATMPTADGPRAHAFWSVPLVAEGKPIGLLGMGFYAPHSFPSDEREFVLTFTRHCAQALLRARRMEAEREARGIAENLQASLSTTLRSIGDAVIATDDKGRITLMNPVAEALTGWREDEARGRPLVDVFRIINEHSRAVVPSPVDTVLEKGIIVGLANHTVLVAKDGRETPIDDSGAPIRRSEGRIEGVVLVFRDVSEKKREEARQAFLADATIALSESLDHEATLAKVARLAVPRLADWCSVDVVDDGDRAPRQLAVAHVDPAKVDYARELGAKYPPDLDAPTGVPNVLRTGVSELYPIISDAMLAAGSVDEERLRILRELKLRSAMVVPLNARGRVLGAMTLVFAESGRTYTNDDLLFAEDLARRCAIAIDNARLYASEQRAREIADSANVAKDDFLAAVSHELRTPLNAILGWSKMLSGALAEEKRRKAVETIERNAVAMTQLIEDLLDVSRIVSGKMRLDVGHVDLASVVDAAVNSIGPAADAKAIVIDRDLAIRADPIVGDGARLQQIVWNLLSNAVKFTDRGGHVSVGLRYDATSVEIVVSDNGKGIDARFLPHVFEPFRQADGGVARASGGLGLGLAITRQLVELHGGVIRVESAGHGKGTTFTVSLPVATTPPGPRPERAVAVPSQRTTTSQAELAGLRILVVDDDNDSRHLLRAVLEQCGLEVTLASSVAQAMKIIEARPPDLLLSDIGMPGESGYDLMRRIRALPPERGGSIPAAALTAYARAEDRRSVLAVGYLMHVPKPLDPEEVIAVVTALARFRAGERDTR